MAEGDGPFVFIIFVVLIAFGGLMLVLNGNYQSDIQRAANTQGIEITISDNGNVITTKKPCVIGLSLQDGKLVVNDRAEVESNGVVATKDKILELCNS